MFCQVLIRGSALDKSSYIRSISISNSSYIRLNLKKLNLNIISNENILISHHYYKDLMIIPLQRERRTTGLLSDNPRFERNTSHKLLSTTTE